MEDLKKKPTEFTTLVIKVIKKIPKGKVATYKQVASLAGKEHASRAVVWILNTCSKKYELPWQRVISSKGKIAFKINGYKFRLQRTMLRHEGIDVQRNGDIDLVQFQYKKMPRKKPNGTPKMFS
jgi:methylated-DNA-protein-cysteine methyltransferase related protein